MIVADVNLLVYLLIPGPHTAAVEKVYERDPHWIAPPLWRSEFLNILVSLLRGRVVRQAEADALWTRAPGLIVAEQEPSGQHVVRVAVKRALSAYDAQYVVLAQDLRTVLVTADKSLARKCPDCAVHVDRFAAGE